MTLKSQITDLKRQVRDQNIIIDAKNIQLKELNAHLKDKEIFIEAIGRISKDKTQRIKSLEILLNNYLTETINEYVENLTHEIRK